MIKLVLATNNSHKAQEIKAILGEDTFTVYLLKEVTNVPIDVEESGATLEENAYIKAIAIFEHTLMPVIADDTGLEIEALDGGDAPGVLSARYAGEHGNDAANRSKVLQELEYCEHRSARFRTVLCYHDGIRTLFAEGICSGVILRAEKGDGGFGYDSIFQPNGHTKSFAEMSAGEKNDISHRRQALNALRDIFATYAA